MAWAYDLRRPAALSPRAKGGLASAKMMGKTPAYGVVGPSVGVSPPIWHQPPSGVVQAVFVHALFGVAMAMAARQADAR